MIPRRRFGQTDEQLSIIGFGGIMVADTTREEAARQVAAAIDRGVNYFDVAPSYGNAEERLGPALAPYRSQVFLACKTAKRTRREAQEELENSLRRLRTDHFELYQLHAMSTEDDYAQATAPGGALEALVNAREKGLVRYLGFSTHAVDVALRLMDAFSFDSVLFPVNWVSWLQGDFGPQVLEKAVAKGVARLALKGMARQRYAQGAARRYSKCWYEPIEDPKEAELALRFTLSQDITAAIPPGESRFFSIALATAERFTPVTAAETADLRVRAAGLTPLFALHGPV
jgi:aryl-alcohol dehydrogenase-like predicted oxidoreductase